MDKSLPPYEASESKVYDRSLRVSGILSDLIQVYVGDRIKPFQVHKGVLVNSSPFFRKAFKEQWNESQQGRIELPEDDPEMIEVYIKWLYFDTIDVPTTISYENYTTIFHGYRFGDKIMDFTFKNSVIDHIIKTISHGSAYPAYNYPVIYEDLPASSCLRQFYIDIWAWAGSPTWFQSSSMKEAPIEFFAELSSKQMEIGDRRFRKREAYPWITDPCQYHEHPEGTPKCSKTSNE